MTTAPHHTGLSGTRNSIDFATSISEIVRQARQEPVLRDLGVPEPDGERPPGAIGSALVALHMAAAYHRLALVRDVVADYAHRAALPAGEPAYFESIKSYWTGASYRRIAQTLYRRAITTNPSLAEAHFGYARVAMALGDSDTAIEHMSRTVELAPHPDTPAHANLHAGAYWHRATLLEDRGDDTAALESYRQALSRVASFGVHHVRVAHFLRRIGLLKEAAAEYRKCMDYSHFYFAEFILPPLAARAPSAAPAAPEPIYITSHNEIVAFWQGQYHAVPEASWADWCVRISKESAQRGSLARFLYAVKSRIGGSGTKMGVPVRRANSISEFEDPVSSEPAATGLSQDP